MSADSVDGIVRAWRRERPDLDVAPLEVLSRVTRLARHLDLARREAFARHGLEAGEFDVLAALRRSGAPYELSPGQLGAATLVSSGTTTNRLDRLESADLIERLPDSADRRSIRVHLTPTGRQRVDAALTDLLESERHLLAALPRSDQLRLATLLKSLVLPFDIDEATVIPR
ncbi:MAG: MarR family winged helix-turn-helix transcriptional regulator [Actinomycetota bacterium]